MMMALGRMGLLHVFGVGLVGQNGASNLIGGLRSAGIENIDGCVSLLSPKILESEILQVILSIL